jgi:hypothetical protein
MTEVEWLACGDGHEMCRCLREQFGAHRRKVGRRKLRLLGCAYCRQLWDAMTDARSRAAVEFAERMADGGVDTAGLSALRDGAARAASEAGFCRRTNRFGWSAPGSRAASAASIALSEQPVACVRAHWAMRHNVEAGDAVAYREWRDGHRELAHLFRDIFGNPFRPVALNPSWLGSDVTALARQMYDSRDFTPMPILADALQDAGCDNADLLAHCTSDGPHVRGCWVVDLLLGKS